ncbi:peptide chain release factor N(5)-glutamine methyltransferase [Gordonia hydrophobica]|uniref:Release factor glutamine methyltransferase n=1 Tax=Gordonia hydrophobica TaxID=40516 RepID=A0ABZ2U1T9_9ACTN|nr:peptide chain release factor N(5)-glutamine methyltransferase [Gordonia hydrophobica]MBM7366591.1 release factor glutamine methyltransferase [Gordonia hydrophobica]
MTRQQPGGADDLRRSVLRRLSDAGVASPGVDAADIVAHVLGVEPGRLLLIDEVSAADRARVEEATARRVRRVPLQHITGLAYFAGLELTVGPGVFIPRPETELLVEWAVSRIAEIRRSGRDRVSVVDLCSGSGALALAIATSAPSTTAVAVEVSATAGEYLQGNIDRLGLANRVRLLHADATDPDVVGPLLANADVVVSNPPYVPASAEVSPEVVHDPPTAVFSGDTGMDLIDALAPVLATHLRPGVPVAIEHDDTTAPRVCDALMRTGGFEQVQSHRDLAGRPRFVSAVRRPGRGSAASPDDCVEGWDG